MAQQTSKTARYVAAESLNRLFRQQLPARHILNRLSQTNRLTETDRKFAMNLVFGVLRNRDSLDFLITRLSTTKVKKLHPFVQQTLAVGLYQIFFLDSVPDSATVNEAVKSCKQARVPQRLQGFVNGLLRNAVREKDKLNQELTQTASRLTNHPEWLSERWQQRYGKAVLQRICSINNQEPAVSLRVNSCKISREQYLQHLLKANITGKKGISPDCVLLPLFRGKIDSLPGYEDGWFQIQDEAAQLATLLLQPIRQRACYLDCCAGLGGKTSHIVQLCQPHKAEVIAIEPEKARQKKFSKNLNRLFPEQNCRLHGSTVQEFAQATQKRFAGILVDAPCSGTGVIRRQPDIRWNRRKNDFIKNQQLQLEILSCAAKLVEPGGVIVYSTCSLEDEENDRVISLFLENNKEFQLSSCSEFLPDKAQQYIRKPIAKTELKGDFLAPLPDTYIDGFFAARLVKKTRQRK